MTLQHTGLVVGQRGALRVISCVLCGFKHLIPIPDADLYSRRFYRDIKPHYRAEYDQDRQWWEAVYSDWLTLAGGAPNRFLLDVGAGTGDFVRTARRLGWIAEGLEPDYDAARQSNLTHGHYHQYRSRHGFGLISAHWVIEHLPDPRDFINWACDMLVPGGLLMLTFPNDFTNLQLSAAKATGKPFYWLHETHVNYFNKDSIKHLLADKFQHLPTKSYGSWQPEKHLLAGRNYLDNPPLGRKLHQDRMREEIEMGAAKRRHRMKITGMLGWGRDITIVARRKQ